MMLARLARMDPTLLHPVNTAARRPKRICCSSSCATVCCVPGVALISAVRFTLKSLGHPVSNPSSERFHKLVLDEVAESIGEMIANNVAAIAELTQRIKALESRSAPWPPSAIQRQSISSRSVEWGLLSHSTSCSKWGIPAAFSERVTLEPSWAYVRSGTKGERLISNYGFPNAGTNT